MRTAYAVRVSSPDGSLRGRAQRLIEDWLAERHPYDDRSAGTRVRVVDEPGWYRVSVDQHIDADLTSNVTLAIRSDGRGLSFEARQVFVPRAVRVSHRSAPQRDMSVLRLVPRLVDLIRAVDAGVAVTSSATTVRDDLGALGVVALCDAPSRTLPVVIESPDPTGTHVFQLAGASRPLAGLAHVAVLADDGARRAFNDAWGAEVIPPTTLCIVWPGRGDVQLRSGTGLAPPGAQRAVVDTLESVIDAAATSLPALPRPRPPVMSRSDDPVPGASPHMTPVSAPTSPTGPPPTGVAEFSTPTADDHADDGEELVTLRELLGALDELEQAWDRVDDLQGAVAAADAMVAAASARVELLESRIDQLVQAKVDLEIRLGRRPDTLHAASPADALAQARALCTNLVFAGTYDRIAELDGIDPTALLVDLAKLDSVALQWTTGDITDTTFSLACRNVGLDFASGVSDTARREFGEDYAVSWNGRTVLAVAHVRRGRGVSHYRIHVHLDRSTRQVVVGHIGRHLRGKHG